MATFVGFSTVNRHKPPYVVTDIDLVKIDLLNAFNTRRGERAMRPDFGTDIHNLIMDPLDELTIGTIVQQAKEVISGEPRVNLVSQILVTERDYGIRMEIELIFLPQNITEIMFLDFEKEAEEAI